jgi:ADP-dependent phosphofructokinase/glucokinase
MKQLVLGSLILFSATIAAAYGCPGEMRAIDAKVPSANLPVAEMSKVKALREEGEKLHKEGKHAESMKALAEAKKLLGV